MVHHHKKWCIRNQNLFDDALNLLFNVRKGVSRGNYFIRMTLGLAKLASVLCDTSSPLCHKMQIVID